MFSWSLRKSDVNLSLEIDYTIKSTIHDLYRAISGFYSRRQSLRTWTLAYWKYILPDNKYLIEFGKFVVLSMSVNCEIFCSFISTAELRIEIMAYYSPFWLFIPFYSFLLCKGILNLCGWWPIFGYVDRIRIVFEATLNLSLRWMYVHAFSPPPYLLTYFDKIRESDYFYDHNVLFSKGLRKTTSLQFSIFLTE